MHRPGDAMRLPLYLHVKCRTVSTRAVGHQVYLKLTVLGFQPALAEEQFRQMPPGWRRSQDRHQQLLQPIWLQLFCGRLLLYRQGRVADQNGVALGGHRW